MDLSILTIYSYNDGCLFGALLSRSRTPFHATPSKSVGVNSKVGGAMYSKTWFCAYVTSRFYITWAQFVCKPCERKENAHPVYLQQVHLGKEPSKERACASRVTLSELGRRQKVVNSLIAIPV